MCLWLGKACEGPACIDIIEYHVTRLTGFRVRAHICAKIKTSLLASSRSRELVGVGHRFGKVSVLAIMPSQICAEKLELTSNADRLKLNGRFGKSTWHN